MANSVITVTVTHQWKAAEMYHVLGTIGVAAGDYPANGLIVSLRAANIKSSRNPVKVEIQGQQKVNGQTQYDYSYVPGADLASGKMKIFTGGAEVAAGATPAGIVNDAIQFEAMFLGQN